MLKCIAGEAEEKAEDTVEGQIIEGVLFCYLYCLFFWWLALDFM